ncbi:hypothetical protein BCR42DRAFT_192891 [Absidia repens]|uniref:C2H2-type domain-containing protein n=1 Tax=Absidia repens TaxID=90262 RepID=A0A1X2IS89_9FUNG|nr:hypothetical protein BCR42DRAFT_192891 [Absidia repens]
MEGQYIIFDNQTLQQALKQTDAMNTRPDIALLPKSAHSKNNTVPIIKPTVLRWADNRDNLQNHRHPSLQTLGKRTSIDRHQKYQSMTSSQDDGSSTRKDSGISMDEPSTVKKQRVMSADQLAPSTSSSTFASRKFACLSSPPEYSRSSSIRASSPSPSAHSSIHPLEMRRPSTAPSSPSYSRRASNLSPTIIKLPALLSVTSSTSLESNPSHHLPKLAPLQQSTRPQKCHLPGISSPHTSAMLKTPSAGSGSISSSSTICQEQHVSDSRQYYQRRPPFQQKQTGQFLCEHIVNSSSGRICGQTFRRSYDLSRHQTIHLKNRPFCYCDQCGKKFTRMDALRRHERVQGHTSKQHLLQDPSPQPLDSPSLPPPHGPNQYYPNPTTTALPSPSSSHATSLISPPTTTQRARV